MYSSEHTKSGFLRYFTCWRRETCDGYPQEPYTNYCWSQVLIDHRIFCVQLLTFFFRDTPLPLIAQTLTYVADDTSKLPSLLTYLSQPYNPPLLIFTSTQPRTTSLAEELIMNGISNVDCLHAGMTKKERDDAVSRMRRGESWVMVTTEVMARGMDFRGIREVINYDFPTSVQSYVHRIGAPPFL